MAQPQTIHSNFNKKNYRSGFNGTRNAKVEVKKPANNNSQVRNAQTAEWGNVTPFQSRKKKLKSSIPDTSENFRGSYAKAGIQPTNLNERPSKPKNDNTRSAAVEYKEPRHYRSAVRIPVKKKKKKNIILREIARLRATTINLGVMAWAGFLWPIVMVPFVVLSLIFLGLSGILDWYLNPTNSTISTVTDSDTGSTFTGAVIGALSGIGDTMKEALFSLAWQFFDKFFGFDINLLHPHNLFMLTHGVAFFFGMCILLAMYIIYTTSLIKCISGEGESVKKGMLLLAIVGYSIPGLNLLPWFMVWAVAVWFYPK